MIKRGLLCFSALWCAAGLSLLTTVVSSSADLQQTSQTSDPTEDTPSNHRVRKNYVTVVGAQWAESRLPLLPYNIATGNLKFKKDGLVSVGYGRVLINDAWIGIPGTKFGHSGFSLEGEFTLAKHFGYSNHLEATAALVLRTPEWKILGPLSVNAAMGNGLSYAFSNPKYEIGTTGVRGIDTRRLQYHISFETEWTHASLPNVHFVTKLHHRSGIYGIISPSKTGSNYLGAGLRFDFN